MDEMSSPTIVDDYGNASAADQCHSHFSLNNWFEKLERLMKNTAWIIIIISASVHFKRLFQSDQGGETCPILFKSGYWLNDKWQPDGCMMHQYSKSETRTCLQNERIALIGDSRMRSLYFQLADSVSQQTVETGKFHSNLEYKESKSNTSIEFYWIPKVDESMDLLFKSWLEQPASIPNLILIGVATWTIKNQKLAEVIDYSERLKKLSLLLNEISRNISLRKLGTYRESNTRFHHEPQIIWIMQDPVVESLLEGTRKTITNDKIDMYNYAAKKVLADSNLVKIMHATTLMAAGKPEESQDGLHYSSFIMKWKVDAIMNSFCNDYIYPIDASCCKDLEKITKLQFNAFAVLATSVILWLLMGVCRKIRERNNKDIEEADVSKNESMLSWLYNDRIYGNIKAMAKLAAIMLYIFLADSSLLYNKEHRRYSHLAFFIPLVSLFVIGLTTRAPVKQTTFLNPDQLNEWKGWMIIIMLLYNYTQAESILPIFVNLRLITSSFLFILGFIHFKQFWYTADYGLYKICKVLTRLNLFCVTLCLVMGHPYQFYYLVPLLTFWFVIIYLLMAIFPRVSNEIVMKSTKKNLVMAAKLIVLFVVVFVVWGHENICEWLFNQSAVSELFVDSDGDIALWRKNSGLNRYAVLYGMTCGYVYVTLKQYNFIKDADHNGLMVKSTLHALLIMVVALIALVAYEIQAFTCESKSTCDQTHAIVSILPIMGYVVIRNIPGFLRTKYSLFFAWVGEMSIELFLCQYHIWLSNDIHGLHVLIPGYPVLNGLITSFTFVCVVHEVKKICETLSEELVTKDVRIMLKRLIAFIIMLIIIWYHKTHEKKPVFY